MRAACLQLRVGLCQREDNLSRALEMARLALEQGAEVLVLPELFLTGFCYEPSAQDSPPYPSLDPFRDLLRSISSVIIGSIRGRGQNLGFCLSPDGIQLRPKIHPFGEEKEHFEGGDRILPVPTSWGMMGIEVCYDLRFPEVARSLALQGAEVLVTVAQFPAERLAAWRTLSIARAIENQMPHIACNWADGGGSLIIDAGGSVLSEAGTGECLIVADIDLTESEILRRRIPCLADRRPEVYLR